MILNPLGVQYPTGHPSIKVANTMLATALSRSSSRALSTGSSSGIPIRFAPHDTFGCYEKCADRRVYLITRRIEQLTITENISRDGNDYQSYAPRGPGEKEHYS